MNYTLKCKMWNYKTYKGKQMKIFKIQDVVEIS